MGCIFNFSDSDTKTIRDKKRNTFPMPNICVYKILKRKYINKFLVLLIHYPHCESFKGNKVLVFKNIRLSEIIRQGYIDPHFGKHGHYPIARFMPTVEGWEMACLLCRVWND